MEISDFRRGGEFSLSKQIAFEAACERSCSGEIHAVEVEGADFLAELAVGGEVGAGETFDVEDEDGMDGALGGTIRTGVGEGEGLIETNRVIGALLVGVAWAGQWETKSGVPALKRGGDFRE